MLQVGEKAIDFELPVRAGVSLRLSDALRRGPVVLLVYPLDWSPG